MQSNTLIYTFLIIFSFLCGCKDRNKNSNSHQNELFYKDVTIKEAYALIMDNKGNGNFIIIDVRTPQEYASGHLENAINIDYNAPTFKESLATFDKDKTYFLYCRTGNRSSKAFEIMKEMDFKKINHMIGGIAAWINEELPIVK